MDLHTVTALHRPGDRDGLAAAYPGGPGSALLAGGTWLFSEPQPQLRELVDLTGLGWPALVHEPDGGLTIGATCTLAELAAEAPLFRQCCRALAGSFKIWHTATVGGNICLALPAGPMTSLSAALDGVAVLWGPAGTVRRMPVAEFVTGVRTTAIRPAEVLRAVEIPASALRARTALRRAALTAEGRSGSVVIGCLGESFALTVTAATERPHRFVFPALPSGPELQAALDGVPTWYDDPHGAPDWRAHVTARLAREIVAELGA
ncbi:MAG: FAD binding domain-containing protein [Pseudonocardia sp.]|nr:FAD binding domain-containing protein [Pseudonocardia sp.]